MSLPNTVVWNDGTGPALYVGGLFTVDGLEVSFAKWDGTRWTTVAGGLVYEWDVTSFLQQEKAAGRHVVTLVLKNTTTSSVHGSFRSKEASGANAPRLLLTP